MTKESLIGSIPDKRVVTRSSHKLVDIIAITPAKLSAIFGTPLFCQSGFKPFSNSWVAIHPDPKGVIQFVGSFFIDI